MNIKYYICVINSHENIDNSIGSLGKNTNIMLLYYEVTPQHVCKFSLVLLVSVALPYSYLSKSTQRHDFKKKYIFGIEYVTEYSVQSLADNFLIPRKFQ
jgi:hypothetical protein